jgi:mono/diheme cytochrome c family protein
MRGLKIVLWLAAVIGCAALGLGAWFAVSLLHNGLSARATPSRLETFLAQHARRMSIPSDAKGAANPVTDSAEVQRDARLHFADHCAVCHGNDGGGDNAMGRGLYPKPPDLRGARTQKLSDGELFWTIENGVRFTGMPAFGGSSEHGNSEDTWKLVRFIRHLPRLTADERMEMEKYNPKGPEDRAEEQREEDFLKGSAPQPAAASPHHH